ncbi:MAG: hypothetical protein IKB38_02325 [Clostridia bacterium]|nr:hypothetical protein [Clostridia bacterium]
MSILKRHSYDIVKLYIDQIGINVFSLILIFAIGSVSSSIGVQLALSVFTTLFFGFILYTTAWDMGAKDRISCDSGRCAACPLKGLILSLFANIPNFLLSLLAAVFLLISKTGSEAMFSAGTAMITLTKFTMAIYHGIVHAAASFSNGWSVVDNAVVISLGYFLVPVISIAITQFGYSFGFKEKKIFGGAMDAKRK